MESNIERKRERWKQRVREPGCDAQIDKVVLDASVL
jgi:hypothetical protein